MSNFLKMKAFFSVRGHMVNNNSVSQESQNVVYEHLQRAAIGFRQTLQIFSVDKDRNNINS